MARIALVTGASGFVGSAVARKLVERGWTVRLLARPESDRRNLQEIDAEIVHGNLRDPSSYAQALRGVEDVFHVAADYRLWVPDPEVMYKTNVDGSLALVRAATAAGAARIVYTSSVAVLGLKGDGTLSDENAPVTLEDMIGHYKRSKFLAEEAVRKAAAEEDLPVVIVNPSTPIGPRDVKPTPTGRIVVQAARGKIPAFVDTGLNVVHVDDVAEGHLLAHAKGRLGERYILGGENMGLEKILLTIAALQGTRRRVVKLPNGAVVPIAYGCELAARVFKGWEPFITMDGVKMARKKMFFSHEKAARELGYQARPAQEAIADALEWFQRAGMV
ncbi:hopanoid-associated sugar epimerase [Rhodoligotrophos defluvii]|uniref:hopanoid-associated sugar epimerase n=1 Tax=Rhodoligotrophos defluvii TaxID=2561934 RepID=UPI0010C9DD55|nr:hopanoid-associated sugar epimerase [Rhodoligotrophos defluvii]